jgi:hypothetical protein
MTFFATFRFIDAGLFAEESSSGVKYGIRNPDNEGWSLSLVGDLLSRHLTPREWGLKCRGKPLLNLNSGKSVMHEEISDE